MIYNETIKLDGLTYDVVASAGEYDYSWEESALLRRQGQLYYAHDSGCSCWSFGDGISAGDLKPVATWQEAVELAKNDLPAEHSTTFAERLAELRPDPSYIPVPTVPVAVRLAQGVNL